MFTLEWFNEELLIARQRACGTVLVFHPRAPTPSQPGTGSSAWSSRIPSRRSPPEPGEKQQQQQGRWIQVLINQPMKIREQKGTCTTPKGNMHNPMMSYMVYGMRAQADGKCTHVQMAVARTSWEHAPHPVSLQLSMRNPCAHLVVMHCSNELLLELEDWERLALLLH